MTAHEIATLLRNAALNKECIQPIRSYIGIDDLKLAYEIQMINNLHRISEGARIVGKKIGLTSISVQKQLGVDQPDFGILFDDRQIENNGNIKMTDLMQPKAETEIAFVLNRDLDFPNLTMTDIIRSVDSVYASIEIAGSRIKDWDIKITDTIADNASASHFILSEKPCKLSIVDLIGLQNEHV